MPDRWAGIKVIGSEIVCVVFDIDGLQRTVIRDVKIPLQNGPRPEAYNQAHGRILDFLQQNQISKTAVVGSAVNHTGRSAANLEAAELRGVVQLAAIQAGATVCCVNMATLKKSKGLLGPLATSEYMDDDAIWAAAVSGNLKKGSREAGVAAIAAQKQETP